MGRQVKYTIQKNIPTNNKEYLGCKYLWKYSSGSLYARNTEINILSMFPITTYEKWVRNVDGTALYFDKENTIEYTEMGHLVSFLETYMTEEELVDKFKIWVEEAFNRVSYMTKSNVVIDKMRSEIIEFTRMD